MNARCRRREFLRPLVEWLEQRRLLACEVFVRDQTLFVLGDEADNQIELLATVRGIEVTCDGRTEVLARVNAVNAQLGDGDDNIVIDNHNCGLGGINFDIFGQGGLNPGLVILAEGDCELLTPGHKFALDGHFQDVHTLQIVGGAQPEKFDVRPSAGEDNSVEIGVTDIGTGFPSANLHVVDTQDLAIKAGGGNDEFDVNGRIGAALHLFGQDENDHILGVLAGTYGDGKFAGLIDFDGGDGIDDLTILGTVLDELFDVVGISGLEIPDPEIRVTDLATGLVTAEFSIVGAEAIELNTDGGDDHIVMREVDAPLSGVDWTILTGTGHDTVDARLAAIPDVLHVLTGQGNDDVSLVFADNPNIPSLPRDPNAPVPEILVDVGAGVDSVMLDVFGSLLSPPSDIAPQITLVEVLAAIQIQGVGLLALLTLFPLGALEMKQAIKDDRVGHTKTEATIAIAGADLSVDLTTGATLDTVLIDLAPLPDSHIDLKTHTGPGYDDITVQVGAAQAPEFWSFIAEMVATMHERKSGRVLVLSEYGDVHERIEIEALWNIDPIDPSKSGGQQRASMMIAHQTTQSASSLRSMLEGSAGRDEIQLDAQLARSSGDIEIDVDWDTGLGDDAVAVNLETAADHVIQKVRTDLGAGDDRGIYRGISQSNGFRQPGEPDGESSYVLLSGLGDDILDVTVEAAADQLEERLTIDGGPGDDRVSVNLPAVQIDGLADLIVGAGPGAGPHVKVFDGGTPAEVRSFFAYDASFAGGVCVAAGDVNGDGVSDIITGAGPGAGPHVKVFDGRTHAELYSFFAYGAGFTGGVFVAAGDVNNDGRDDIITGADASQQAAGGHVKVFDGRTGAEIQSFFAFDPNFTGGVRVAAGDVNGDGFADIMAGAGPAGGGHVKVFDGRTLAELHSIFAYGANFAGGVFVAAGDINGDGRADIITGADASQQALGGHVKVFDGATGAEVRSFFAFDLKFAGGVRVAAGDVNGDGFADIVTGAGPGAAGGPVRVFDGRTHQELRSFFAFEQNFSGGVYVAAGDLHSAVQPEQLDLVLAIDTDAGADSVEVQLGAVATEELLQKVRIDTGPQADSVQLEVFFPSDPCGIVADIGITTGDGNDAVEAALRTIPGQPTGPNGLEPQELDQKVRIDTGAGDDALAFDWLVHTDRQLMSAIELLTGAGNDTTRVKLADGLAPQPQEPDFRAVEVAIQTGQGDDLLLTDVVSFEVQALRRLVRIDTGDGADRVSVIWHKLRLKSEFPSAVADDLDIDTGAGDDRAEVELQPASAADNIYSFKLRLGDGNDIARYWVFGTELPPAAGSEQPVASLGRFDLQVLGGLGNDDIQGRVGSNRDGQLLPLFQDNTMIEIDGGGGRDRLSLDYRGAILDQSAVDVIMRGGAGDDQVRARLDLDPESTGELSVQVFGDDGNDELGLAVLNADDLDMLFALLDGGRGKDRCRTTPNVMVVNCP